MCCFLLYYDKEWEFEEVTLSYSSNWTKNCSDVVLMFFHTMAVLHRFASDTWKSSLGSFRRSKRFSLLRSARWRRDARGGSWSSREEGMWLRPPAESWLRRRWVAAPKPRGWKWAEGSDRKPERRCWAFIYIPISWWQVVYLKMGWVLGNNQNEKCRQHVRYGRQLGQVEKMLYNLFFGLECL